MNFIEVVRNGLSFVNKLTNAEDHKISEYKIYCNDKSYTLSREQVELLYRNYVHDGYNLSIREIASYFSLLTVADLMSIRQAFFNTFGLTKEDTIITPHEIEENSLDEIRYIISEFVKSKKVLEIKSDLPKVLNKVISEQQQEISKLKDYKTIVEECFKDAPFEIPYISQTPDDRSIAIWISDMHIGCRVNSANATMRENIGWNNEMVLERLNKLLEAVRQLGHFNHIWVFNLGDAIDGMNGTTSRQDVDLPQNMDNSEMVRNYRQDINYLFDTMIGNNMANNYHFRTVSQSNHGGDFEALASEFIVEELRHKGIDSNISETAFGVTMVHNTPVVYGHGKDNLYQMRPLSERLDTKTKDYIDALLRANGLSSYFGNILVVKGDSHQYHLSGCADYVYMSVGSLFGSSEWAQSNFPCRGWEINYTIFNDSTIMHGSVKDNTPHTTDVQFI